MSIALSNRVKELEAQVAHLQEREKLIDELAYALVMIRKGFQDAEKTAEGETPADIQAAIKRMYARLEALENRPKPGRPPKHG